MTIMLENQDIKYICINVVVYPNWKTLQGFGFKIPSTLGKEII